MRVIQRGDLLALTDLNTHQLWVASELVDDINGELEINKELNPGDIAEVLERLATILRKVN